MTDTSTTQSWAKAANAVLEQCRAARKKFSLEEALPEDVKFEVQRCIEGLNKLPEQIDLLSSEQKTAYWTAKEAAIRQMRSLITVVMEKNPIHQTEKVFGTVKEIGDCITAMIKIIEAEKDEEVVETENLSGKQKPAGALATVGHGITY